MQLREGPLLQKPATVSPVAPAVCAPTMEYGVGGNVHTTHKQGSLGTFSVHLPNKFHLDIPGRTRPQRKWRNCFKIWSLFPQTAAGLSRKEGL